jgi:hypothetical protein
MIVLAWVRSSGLAVHTCRAIAAFFFLVDEEATAAFGLV